ncbi:MAG: hypothetical protein QXZ17_14620 [Nitrososphaerota archaeon]
MKVGLVLIGAVLLVVGLGVAALGLSDLGASGGHVITGVTGNATAVTGTLSAVAIVGYVMAGFGIMFIAMGGYLLYTGIRNGRTR